MVHNMECHCPKVLSILTTSCNLLIVLIIAFDIVWGGFWTYLRSSPSTKYLIHHQRGHKDGISHRNHTPKSSLANKKKTMLFWHNWSKNQLINRNTFIKNGIKVSWFANQLCQNKITPFFSFVVILLDVTKISMGIGKKISTVEEHSLRNFSFRLETVVRYSP